MPAAFPASLDPLASDPGLDFSGDRGTASAPSGYSPVIPSDSGVSSAPSPTATASGTPRPHALGADRRGRSPLVFVAGALIGITTGGLSAAWFVSAQPGPAAMLVPPADPAAAAALAPSEAHDPTSRTRPADDGVNVETLPRVTDPLRPAAPQRGPE